MGELCHFYHKVGACRHGSKCVRKHVEPQNSTVIMCVGMVPQNFPKAGAVGDDVLWAACQIAPVRDILVASNSTSHLQGNVYLAFDNSREAKMVLENFNRRWYAGQPVYAQLTAVRDLRGAQCHEVRCNRGLECNYVHAVPLSSTTLRYLNGSGGERRPNNNHGSDSHTVPGNKRRRELST